MIDDPLVNTRQDTTIIRELSCILAIWHAVCSRMCLNGGTLDEETCTCDCAGGFSGDNCESELSACIE